MENSNIFDPASNTMSTRFTSLKQQQCALNMQIRLAMQIHDAQAQADLEKEMEKINEQIRCVSVHS